MVEVFGGFEEVAVFEVWVCICVCVGGEGEGAQVAEDAMMVCARAGCWNLDGKQGSRWYVREAYR
jgi:hypothetical protein